MQNHPFASDPMNPGFESADDALGATTGVGEEGARGLVEPDAEPHRMEELAEIDDACDQLASAAVGGNCVNVGRYARRALDLTAVAEDFAPAIEEAIGRGDHNVLLTLVETLGMDRVAAAVPDFMFLAALADSDSIEPMALPFFIRRGGLRYRAKARRGAKEPAAEAEREAISRAEKALRAAGGEAGQVGPNDQAEKAEAQGAGHTAAQSTRVSLQGDPAGSRSAADAEISVRAWLAYDNCLLDAVLSVTAAGASIVEIREAILASDRLERETESERHAQAIQDANESGAEGEASSASAGGSSGARAARQASRAEASRRGAERAGELRQHGERQARRARVAGSGGAPTAGQRLRAVANSAQLDGAAAAGGPTAANRASAALSQQRVVLPAAGLQVRGAGLAAGPRALGSARALVAMFGTAAAVGSMFAAFAGFSVSSSIGGVGGLTPLHLAAQSGNLEAVRELLANGADPEAVDFNGMRPSEIAAMGGFQELVEELNAAVEQAPLREAVQEAIERLERQERVEAAQNVRAHPAESAAPPSQARSEDAKAHPRQGTQPAGGGQGDPSDEAEARESPSAAAMGRAASNPLSKRRGLSM